MSDHPRCRCFVVRTNHEWSYRLHNPSTVLGMSCAVDLYAGGRFTGWSTGQMSVNPAWAHRIGRAAVNYAKTYGVPDDLHTLIITVPDEEHTPVPPPNLRENPE